MAGLGAPELIIIGIVIFALFGYKKLPDAARSIGRSMRIFKTEINNLNEKQGNPELNEIINPINGTETPAGQ